MLRAPRFVLEALVGDVIWPARFAAQGWIADLSDRFTDTEAYLPGPMPSNTCDGKVWGVPWYTDAGLLYNWGDLLEKNGFSEPPQNWEDLKEMALKTKQDSEMGSSCRGPSTRAAWRSTRSPSWANGGDDRERYAVAR